MKAPLLKAMAARLRVLHRGKHGPIEPIVEETLPSSIDISARERAWVLASSGQWILATLI